MTRPLDDATEGLEFDVDAIREYFPALSDGTAYFDGPGGSQTPTVVADAIRDAILRPLSNRGNTTTAARNAEESSRSAVLLSAICSTPTPTRSSSGGA